jgi:Pilin (bacterial filament)
MRESGFLHPARSILLIALITSIASSNFAQAANDAPMPIRSAWLNEHLPTEALAYQRIPHPLGIFATPKGNALDPALRSPANAANVGKIQQGILDNVLPLIPDLDDARIRFLAGKLDSPLELAVFAAPAPSVLVAMHLKLDSAMAFEAAIGDLAESDPPLALAAPLDARGYGQLLGMPAPAFMHFDAATGRLLAEIGPGVSAESFGKRVDSLVAANSERMRPIEKQLDQSGQGWFLWIDAEKTLPVAQMFMPPENLAQLQASGLDKVRTAGLGWGVADGKGRLGVVLDVAPDGNRQFLPFVRNDLNLSSVGKPDALALLSLPTAEELARIESLVLASMDPEDRDNWQAMKDKLQAEIGASIEDIFGALGPELLGIFDSVGDYGAIRLRDKALFDRLMDGLAKTGGTAPDSHRANGKTFYHWSMPGDLATLDAEALAEMGPAAEIMLRHREHIYWVQDGDFLYVASVPQPLLDRIAKGADTRIDRWLREQQHIDPTTSFLVVAGSSHKLPMRLYHIYIELLQMLGDLSGVDIDVWNMPTAKQLSLASEGVLGFTVNLGDPYVSLGLTFESNPGEVLFGSGAGTIAVIGILAGIAIPAYQDYTVRAHVSEGLNLAAQVQDEVAEYYLASGELPPPSVAATMGDNVVGQFTESVRVMPGTGIIVISYFEEAVSDGGQLFLEPVVGDDGAIEWVCSGTLPQAHMPAACRDNELPDVVHGGA